MRHRKCDSPIYGKKPVVILQEQTIYSKEHINNGDGDDGDLQQTCT